RIGKMQKYVCSVVCVKRYKVPRKLQEWDDEDGFGPTTSHEDTHNANKINRVVVLKHMFTLRELEEDASLLLDLKEDVREECTTLGDVTNVVLYDVSSDLEVQIDFSLSTRAERSGRYYDRQISRSPQCTSVCTRQSPVHKLSRTVTHLC